MAGSQPRTSTRRDLPHGRDPRPELEEVLAEHELERVGRAEVAARRRLRGLPGPPELELALHDGDLEADRPGKALEELPVRLAGLADVRVDPAAVVDRPGLQARRARRSLRAMSENLTFWKVAEPRPRERRWAWS